ncbi:MAG: tetratricopeptide repeat protein [Gammaproteobacteria bacterium]|nr:tetratricopeptide repeat protein [Gammaproteobacteria bacterium]
MPLRTARVLLASAAVLVLLGSLPGCGGPDSRRASHMARGREYMASGKLDKARVEFANALQISPNDVEARYLTGLVAERLGDFRAAAAAYQGTIEADPKHVQGRARLARLYELAGRPHQALELLEPAMREHPDDPQLLTARGAARAELKDNSGALIDAERAVAIAPRDESAVLLLAGMYRVSGQSARAIELLGKTIATVPDSADLHQALASLYFSSGDTELAERQLLQLVQIRPGELPPRLQLASFYIRSNRPDDAESALKAAVAALPRSDQAKLAYADFLSTHRSRAQGETALRQLIAQDPANLDLQLGLAALQQRAGATQEAAATYRTIIAKDPNGAKGVTARDLMAAMEATAGRPEEALPLLAEVLKHNPRDLDALTLRGNIELQLGEDADAIADLRAVLREQPTAIPILRCLARAHLANDEPALAEESLRTALAAAPHDLGVRVDLGELLTRTHRPEQAVALLREAIKDAPDARGGAARATLVEAYLAKPDLPEARSAAEDLKAVQPEAVSGWYLAGLVARQQKRPEDARREFEHALTLQPSATQVLAALARVESELGRHAQALAVVRNAATQAPESAGVRNLLGELYLANKSYPEAIHALDEAVRLAPGWWVPYANLGSARLAAKDTAGAVAAYEAGVQSTHASELVISLATLYEQQGRFEDAIRQYEQLHERRPRLKLATNNLAMLLVTHRQDRASLDRARDLTASFADSQVAALLDTRGWVMLKRGEVFQALPELERAAAGAPDSKEILYHLGMAQLRAGQPDKARASLEEALANGASFSGADEARLALARLSGRSS